MTVANFFLTIRRIVRDLPVLTGEKFDGDASTTTFRTKHAPILDDSYTVKVGGVTKTEITDYTIDQDTGDITFTSAPAAGSDNVTISYKYAKIGDTQLLDIFNSIIISLRKKIWSDNIDSATMTTVANQSEYDLDDISENIWKVIEVWYRSSSNNDWSSVNQITNVEYWREQNKLNIRPYFTTTGDALKIRYLENYAEYTATSETITIPDRFLKPIRYFMASEYLDVLMALMIKDMGANTQENTYEAMGNIRGLKKDWEQKAEKILSRVRPIMPSTNIPVIIQKIKS